LSYQILIANTGWTGIKTTYWKLMIQYFAIQNTISAITRKYWNTSFFLLWSVSDRFKPIVPFCVMFTHWNDMKQSISQWNWWKIEIMIWENNMKPSISQWKQWKIKIIFWENDMKQSIQYWKILIYDCFLSIFHKKKDLDNEYKLLLSWELSCSYCILSYHIVSISNRIF